MLTKNYYRLIGSAMNTNNYLSTYTYVNGTVGRFMATYNTDITVQSYKNGLGFANTTTLINTGLDKTARPNGVSFGNGTAAPTLDDYYLSGSIITGITADCNRSVVNNDDDHSVTTLYTITNHNSESVTINEIGYFYYPNVDNSIMLDHTVLETPLTIPAGGVGQVTYTIRFNYPTAE